MKKFIELFNKKFNCNLNETYNEEYVDFILESFNKFCRQFVYISTMQIIKNRDIEDSIFLVFKEIERIKCLEFKIDNKSNKFHFIYKKDDKEIFSLTAYLENEIYTVEESYKKEFFEISYGGYPKVFSKFKFLKNKIEEHMKDEFVIVNYYKFKNKIMSQSPLYRNVIIKNKKYIVQDNSNFFNMYYFYNEYLNIKEIMYYREEKDFFIRVYYNLESLNFDCHNNIDSLSMINNISPIFLEYLKKSNKNIEDINEEDLKLITMITY